MRKIVLGVSVIALFLGFIACKKSDSSSNARTVQNLSGSYTITALTATSSGVTINLYDSLPPCQKDNTIKLNTDLTVQFIDDGTACVPPSDSTGVWSLSANTDSLYVADISAYIESWDGKTLVVSNQETISGFPVTATTTLTKK